MSNSRYGNTGKDKGDDLIGRLLAGNISNAGVRGECPSLEDIAAFIDNRLDGKHRMFVMGHLSSCKDCYYVFSETAKSINEVSPHSASGRRKTLYYVIPSAVAAAAILLLVIKLSDKPVQPQQSVVQQEKPLEKPSLPEDTHTDKIRKPVIEKYDAPSIGNIANVLIKDANIKSLADLIKSGATTSYGFAGSSSAEKRVFIAGGYLIDLELLLMADDKEMSLSLLDKLIPSLRAIELPKANADYYIYIQDEIKRGARPQKFAGKGQAIDKELRMKNLLLYYRFGLWLEGGRLAAISQNRSYFDGETAGYFIKGLEGMGLPEWVLTSLNEIDKVSSDGVKDIKDFRRLRRLFEEIQQGLSVSL
jgi:hypothetical protein